jgi:hypothetical protein
MLKQSRCRFKLEFCVNLYLLKTKNLSAKFSLFLNLLCSIENQIQIETRLLQHLKATKSAETGFIYTNVKLYPNINNVFVGTVFVIFLFIK